MAKNRLETEVLKYQLSEFEQDTLSYYPGIVSTTLLYCFRDAMMVFHNILHELWEKGARLRIVPKNEKLVDMRECIDLRKYRNPDGSYQYEDSAGIYRVNEKLIVIREKEFLRSKSSEHKYETIIHEFAHAIWHLILSQHERAHVAYLRQHELKERSKLSDAPGEHYRVEYARTHASEFFAESFLYYARPHRQGRLGSMLGIMRNIKSGERVTVVELDEEGIVPDKGTLKNANLGMFYFLESKFKGIIDPDMIWGKPDGFDDMRFGYHSDKHIYYYVIYCGSINGISNF